MVISAEPMEVKSNTKAVAPGQNTQASSEHTGSHEQFPAYLMGFIPYRVIGQCPGRTNADEVIAFRFPDHPYRSG